MKFLDRQIGRDEEDSKFAESTAVSGTGSDC